MARLYGDFPPKRRAPSEHCKGAHVCLVGANGFQNNLFATTLREIYQCQNIFHVISSLPNIPEHLLSQKEHKVVFYLDCFDFTHHDLQALLYTMAQAIQPQGLFALFNLNADVKIERAALNYGARGFFYQDDSLDDFCKGIRKILGGEVWLTRKLASDVILAGVHTPSHNPHAEAEAAHLTKREKDVLAHLFSGATNKEIAAALFISPHTLRTHLNHIYIKINVHTRMQAIRWAEKNIKLIR